MSATKNTAFGAVAHRDGETTAPSQAPRYPLDVAAVFATGAARAWRAGDFRKLDRVPPACSYTAESGPYAARMPLRKRVTRSFNSRTLSSRFAFTPSSSTLFWEYFLSM